MTDKHELKEIFGHFDGDHNGRIDCSEFKKLMKALDADLSPEELDIGFDIIDSDNNGSIEFEEFIQWWTNR